MARFSTPILLLLNLLIASSQGIEIISRFPDLAGYEFRGPLGYVFNSPDAHPGLIRLYAVTNSHTLEVIYTTNQKERQHLLRHGDTWEDDETPPPAFHGNWVYGDAGPAKDRVPLYRLTEKSTHEHLWTVNGTEAEDLKTKGWKSQGITCYFPNPVPPPAEADLRVIATATCSSQPTEQQQDRLNPSDLLPSTRQPPYLVHRSLARRRWGIWFQ